MTTGERKDALHDRIDRLTEAELLRLEAMIAEAFPEPLPENQRTELLRRLENLPHTTKYAWEEVKNHALKKMESKRDV